MGEIAEDMLNGHSCSLCGVYFEGEHGFPVVCESCYDDLDEEDKTLYQKAFLNEY